MKRVVIVHGFKSKPDTNWKPWLKEELRAKGFTVEVPAMPNTAHPVASEWNEKLTGTVGNPNEDTYLVGHSLGSITVLRYLESLKGDQRVGGAILLAGFGERFQKYNEGSHDSFFDHDLNWQDIREHCGQFTAIHDEDDQNVEIGQLEVFRRKLGAKVITTKGKGHYGSPDGVYEVPIVRDELVKMAAEKQDLHYI